MRVRNFSLAILMAVSLCWVLFAQDQAAVFESDPTSDLPEMMTSAAIDSKPHQDEQQPAPLGTLTRSPVAPSQTVLQLIASDVCPPALAYSEPLVWQLNNPPTAPPAA